MQEIETLLVSFLAFVGKRREGRRKLAYNIIDEAVARWFEVMLLREFTDLAVNNRDAERRGLEGEAFDQLS